MLSSTYLAPGESDRLQALLAQAERTMLSDAGQAAVLAGEAAALARQLGAGLAEAQATMLLGVSCYYRSEFHQANDWLHQALALAEQAGDELTAARITNSLGTCAVSLGEYGQGMEYYQQSLSTAQKYGAAEAVARALNNIALVYTELGDYQVALGTYEELTELTRGDDLGLQMAHSAALINVVPLHVHLEQFGEGLAKAELALPQVRSLGFLQHEVVLRGWTLPCLIGLGRVTQALEQAEELLPLAQQVGDHEHIVYTRLFWGQALLELGRLTEAEQQLRAAQAEAEAYDILPLKQRAVAQLSGLYAARGEWELAYTLLLEGQALDRKLRDEALKRKAQVLGAQMQMEFLRQEAEAERRRSSELTHANAELKAAQQALAYRAAHDSLTGLANRAYFQSEMERALERGQPFGLLFIDLDRFKQINDTLGHEIGDELLREVAQRLRERTRPSDLVARMGGDEFTVILQPVQPRQGEAAGQGLYGPQGAEERARELLLGLSEPFELHGYKLHITASGGVAVAPQDGQDAGTLQKHADIAMYRAKRAGKNAVLAFEPLMAEETAERAALENDLRLALELEPCQGQGQGQLRLYYQGQFGAQSGRLEGFEALVRWEHPTQGLLGPARFIEIAEESGLIVPLGEWALREACRQAVAWEAERRGLSISVNVSALQFEHSDFLEVVQAALDWSGLPAHHLTLELTETMLLGNHERAFQRLARLRELGVQLALDDFGTGYSSLGLLQKLRGDVLKIDSSFVQDERLRAAGSGRALVEFLIMLAHRLGMEVVAEGVETQEQYEVLRSLHCDLIQGFLLGKPEPAAVAARRLP